MTDASPMPWHQRLSNILQRPLSYNRAHQDTLYKAAHVSSFAAVYGWGTYALAGLFGWAAPALLLATAGVFGVARHLVAPMLTKHFTRPLDKVDMSVGEVTSRVLPLCDTTVKTYLQDKGLERTYAVRFDDSGGGYYTTFPLLKQPVLSICRGAVDENYRRCVNSMGANVGTSTFIYQQGAIMAHEHAHMTAPALHHLCDFKSINRATLLAAPLAWGLAAAGVMATPTLAATFMALAAFGVARFGEGVVSRAEEFRADRKAVLENGTSLPLSSVFNPVQFSLPQAVKALFVHNEHPSYHQRCLAMFAADQQLTQQERTDGQARLRHLHDRIAPQHADMFIEKPASATPAGILTRSRAHSFN